MTGLLPKLTRVAVLLVCIAFWPQRAGAESAILSSGGIVFAGVNATFAEQGSPGGDLFTITNTSAAGVGVTRIVIDTSTSKSSAYFDIEGPGSTPFIINDATATATGFLGFTGAVDGSTLIVLEFDNFDAGETFVFDVDLDDTTAWSVTGKDFSGTSLTASFGGIVTATDLTGYYERKSLLAASLMLSTPLIEIVVTAHNPEPSSLILFGIGMAGLLGYGWRHKRRKKIA